LLNKWWWGDGLSLRVRRVLAAGVSIFAESLRRQGLEVVELDWSPPAEVEKDLEEILDKLM
jgi:hypothetical protein